jgi:hypothetical protein
VKSLSTRRLIRKLGVVAEGELEAIVRAVGMVIDYP